MDETASNTEFNQAEVLFKYSQTTGFPDLVQEDINHDGRIYQAYGKP